MSVLRGALIGCGFFARHHLEAWRRIEDVEIVSLCDLDITKAEAYAAAFGTPSCYDDPLAMIAAETLDFVDIATQASTHHDLVRMAADAGLAVICQKPLAPGFEEASAVVDAARDVTFMVHENFRWQPAMLELKRVSGELGPLFFGRLSFRSGYDVYADQPYLATDDRFILYDVGVHTFDLARFFLGEATSLLCHTARVNPNIVGEDVATTLLHMRNGAHVVVDMSYASSPEHELFPQTLVHLEGANGEASLGADYQIRVTTKAGTRRIDATPQPLWMAPAVSPVPASVLAAQRHFVRCLATGTEPDTSGADNLKTLELTFGAYRSADTGRLVRVGL